MWWVKFCQGLIQIQNDIPNLRTLCANMVHDQRRDEGQAALAEGDDYVPGEPEKAFIT